MGSMWKDGWAGRARTTMSESLGLDVETEKARICGLAARLAERAAVRNTKGANMLAMMGVVVFNCRNRRNFSPPRSRCRQVGHRAVSQCC